MIHYHADDSSKAHNSNITTQSKIFSFVFEHYTLADYGKENNWLSLPFFASQYVHMHSKIIHQPTFVCMVYEEMLLQMQ